MLQVAVPPPAPAPMPPVIVQDLPVPPWVTLPPQVTLLIVVAFMAGVTIVLYPLMRAIARRIEGKVHDTRALEAEIEHLRSRLGEVDQMQARLGELEERLDFAERLLTQRRERANLPGGSSE